MKPESKTGMIKRAGEMKMKTVNLYDESGIAVHLTAEFDICGASDDEPMA